MEILLCNPKISVTPYCYAGGVFFLVYVFMAKYSKEIRIKVAIDVLEGGLSPVEYRIQSFVAAY
ncbi:hypothetical protein [Paenibacillus kribbensis]|uniref:hypothetical protein n=1 Tax=Paenibacillus kribbensis TaxID=172713 RepID=UPI00114D3BFA|nr:hypothetical protein [Paenibacillus kribbensis]